MKVAIERFGGKDTIALLPEYKGGGFRVWSELTEHDTFITDKLILRRIHDACVDRIKAGELEALQEYIPDLANNDPSAENEPGTYHMNNSYAWAYRPTPYVEARSNVTGETAVLPAGYSAGTEPVIFVNRFMEVAPVRTQLHLVGSAATEAALAPAG